MKVRNPLGSLRLLSAIAAAASPTFFSVAAVTLVATNCQTASAQLQVPPTLAVPQNQSNPAPTLAVPPASNAALQPSAPAGKPVAAPQLMPGSTADAGQLLPPNPLRDRAVALAAEAKLAVTRGELTTARSLIDQANSLRVPESAYAPNQLRPWQVAMDLARAEMQRNPNMAQNAVQPAGGANAADANLVQPGVFQPKTDNSQVQPAGALQVGRPPVDAGSETGLTGEELYRQGVDALTAQNKSRALELFSAAWKKEAEMDPLVRGQLKDKLTNLTQVNGLEPVTPKEMPPGMQAVSQEQALLRQKTFREVTTEIAESERMVNDQPLAALDRLRLLRQRVSQSAVEGAARKEYLAMVDRVINNVEAYVEQNKAAINQQERNTAVEDKLIADAALQAKLGADTQRLVDEFNELTAARRFEEAEIVAKKVSELNPDTEIGVVMLTKARIARRNNQNEMLQEMKADARLDAMAATERAMIMQNPDEPYSMPANWDEISRRRLRDEPLEMTPSERMIRQKLTEAVSVSFQARPLGYAVDTISQMTGIPIIVDPLGMAAEGLTPEQPVSLELNGNSVSLKSALNLLLEPLGLTYVVKDEVLKITSRSTITRERRAVPYPVADLVIPIPNFVNTASNGFAGALQAAYQTQVGGLIAQTPGQFSSVSQLARNAGASALNPNSPALGQAMPQGFGANGMGSMGSPLPGSPAGAFGNPMNMGNGGAGGGANADFTTLIDLIQTTIPGDWDTGEDTITQFPSNLSLIINAPLETHEQIAALLKQLRALQNLQVTIEIRFITLSDNFFERMGVDFDFNIDDNAGTAPGLPRDDSGPSTAFGLSAAVGSDGVVRPTTDLDIQFRQDGFGSAVPPFGNFAPAAGAQLGFAILSDLELFFFLNAAQGDSRTNVMQAPKLTMFDGQFANIFDGAQVPFVVGLQPIVGDFAVAQQPIIVILNDGTQLGVQSVVTADKRFVRMTLSPSFTNITDRDRTFTFTGENSTDSGEVVTGPNGDPLPDNNNQQRRTVGSTVQLPTVGITSINTTVTVPDGGTILLGGIKRLSEGRTERGVPMLSKIPYINRLFSNLAIGREARTLMMTVTPRIIIPEEEEERVLGGAVLP